MSLSRPHAPIVRALLFACTLTLLPHPAAHAAAADVNATARWLAGQERDAESDLAKEEQLTDAAWEKLRQTRLVAMEQFARTHFPGERAQCDTLFYPFGGPDILNALSFFPDCRRYVLFGLERVGELPALDKLSAEQKKLVLEDMHKAQQYILRRNFFVTQYMMSDLNTPHLKGVLPLVVATLARMNYTVLAVVPANLDGSEPATAGERVRAVRVRFAAKGAAAAQEQELFFASFDASDSGLEKRPDFLQYMTPMQPTATLLKAASYLLYDKSFRFMRMLIEDKTQLLVQDDSGMPYAELLAHGFRVDLYGNYVDVIPAFHYRYQKDLAAAYGALPRREPLSFAWSYAWKPSEIGLQIARKDVH